MSATVICPVTPHEPEVEATVGLAADLAARRSAVLALVDVAWPAPSEAVAASAWAPAAPLDVAVGETEAALAGEPARRRETLAELGRAAGHDAVLTESLCTSPWTALRDLSSRPDTELVVVHDAGGGALRSKVTGNAGREILRDARCPIVLTPPGCGGSLPDTPKLLCLVDDDELAVTVAAFAAHLGTVLGVPVHVAHAAPDDDEALPRFERLAARCRDAMGDARASFTPLFGAADEMVIAEASWMDADLVVAGRPRHGALGSALSRSVVHALAARGCAPVVVVPDALHLAG